MPTKHQQRLAVVAAVVLVLCGAAARAFFEMFTSFQAYDDEGYLLISLQSFLDGGSLYDEVYTQYGPAYYLVFGGLFRVFGVMPSTDAGRFVTLAAWLIVPLLIGFASWIATRRSGVAVVGGLAAFATMPLLIAEPMHPVGLTSVLLAAISLSLMLVGRQPGLAWPALGVLVAFLALTKVNLGAFAVLAIGFALAVASQHRASRRLVRMAVAVLVLAPVLLLLPDLTDRGPYNVLLLVWAGSFAMIAVTFGIASAPVLGTGAIQGAWRRGLPAGALTGVVVLAITLALGSSVDAVVDGLLIEPSKLRDVYVNALTLPDATAWWAVAAVLFAVTVRRRDDARLPAGPAGVAIRLVAGLMIVVSTAQVSPLSFGPVAGPLPVGALLIWLALIPPAHVARDGASMFIRVAVVALGLVEILQVYPVAGTQMRAASLLYVVPAAIIIGDALDELDAWRAPGAAEHAAWVQQTVRSGVWAVAVALVLSAVVQPLIASSKTYRDSKPLVTAGSSTLRLPADRAAGYADLARTVRRECSALVTYPGFNSLHLWSGVKPPSGLNAGTWMVLLDDDQQQTVVDAVADEPRTCLVRNGKVAASWLQGRPLPDRPLARFVSTGFEAPRPFLGGEYELLVRTR